MCSDHGDSRVYFLQQPDNTCTTRNFSTGITQLLVTPSGDHAWSITVIHCCFDDRASRIIPQPCTIDSQITWKWSIQNASGPRQQGRLRSAWLGRVQGTHMRVRFTKPPPHGWLQVLHWLSCHWGWLPLPPSVGEQMLPLLQSLLRAVPRWVIQAGSAYCWSGRKVTSNTTSYCIRRDEIWPLLTTTPSYLCWYSCDMYIRTGRGLYMRCTSYMYR